MEPKTELQKQQAGESFWNSDPAVTAAKSRARALCDRFNQTPESEPAERLRILKELFGSCDDDIFLKPPFHCDFGYNLHVGKRFFANYEVVILDTAPVTIGDNCLIGPQCGLYTAVHPMDAALRAQNFIRGEAIIIGDNVWFGGHCTVLPGVTIGSGAIIGAGSVVTHDVPPYAVVAGNPARILRYTT